MPRRMLAALFGRLGRCSPRCRALAAAPHPLRATTAATARALSSAPPAAGLGAVPDHLAGRLPSDAGAAEGLLWLEERFATHQKPARSDLEAALALIDDEDDLDAAFARMRQYRANAIPLTRETAAATIAACLRSGRVDMAVHALSFHRQLRFWPGGEEYAAVVAALLADAQPEPAAVADALHLLEGAAKVGVALPQEATDAVYQAAAAQLVPAAASAASADAAADAGEENEDGDDAEESAEESAEEGEAQPQAFTLRQLQRVLTGAAAAGSAPSAEAAQALAEAVQGVGGAQRAAALAQLSA